MTRRTRVRRQRGCLLTPAGLQRLQRAIRETESHSNDGRSLSFEQIAECGSLDVHTVRRALAGTERVDRSTLVRLFQGFGLELRGEDFVKPLRACKLDWGGAAFDEESFLGRQQELETLSHWVERDRCRTVVVYGAAGIGKTSLVLQAARQWQDHFECVVWRSLQNPLLPREFLRDLLETLAPELRQDPDADFTQKLLALLASLERQRCLLVLDGVESLFVARARSGEYEAQWADYGEFFEKVGATEHNSCLLLASQVLPREIAAAEWEASPVRSLCLGGLSTAAVGELLLGRNLPASDADVASLTQQYSGNPLLLNLTLPTIRNVFAGNVGGLVAQDFSVYGDIQDLLAAQLEQLAVAEREALACLATARSPLSLAQLLQVSSLSASNLTEALESLLRRALVARQDRFFTCLPAIREYFTRLLPPPQAGNETIAEAAAAPETYREVTVSNGRGL